MSGHWQRLGLAPTDDERAIKRAYAALLKQTRPEDDPAAFQRLRDALEAALHEADSARNEQALAEAEAAAQDEGAGEGSHPEAGPQVCPDCGKVHGAFPDLDSLPENERAIVEKLQPWIEELTALNRDDRVEEAIFRLLGYKNDPYCQDPLVAEIFEDGVLYTCCEDRHIHDYFVRAAIDAYGWLQADGWLNQKEPQTVEWLQVRLQESDAIDVVEKLLDCIEQQNEALAIEQFDHVLSGDLLLNVDVKSLFEGELMLGLSQFEPLPLYFLQHVMQRLAWYQDHRHLQSFHPQAWLLLRHKLAQTAHS